MKKTKPLSESDENNFDKIIPYLMKYDTFIGYDDIEKSKLNTIKRKIINHLKVSEKIPKQLVNQYHKHVILKNIKDNTQNNSSMTISDPQYKKMVLALKYGKTLQYFYKYHENDQSISQFVNIVKNNVEKLGL
jgi:hypothetical protein